MYVYICFVFLIGIFRLRLIPRSPFTQTENCGENSGAVRGDVRSEKAGEVAELVSMANRRISHSVFPFDCSPRRHCEKLLLSALYNPTRTPLSDGTEVSQEARM